MRIVVMVSGSGTNLQSVLDAVARGDAEVWPAVVQSALAAGLLGVAVTACVVAPSRWRMHAELDAARRSSAD